MKLIKLFRDVIISPHGITDISHSIQTNNQINLLKINTLMLGSTSFIINPYNLDNMLNIIFLTSSIIHFSHDMPNLKFNQNYISKYLLSTLLFFILNFIGLDFIIYYMVIIHVPNHYISNKDIVFNDLNTNIFLISLISIICLYFDYYLCLNFNNDIINFLKSIIISHVIYQEKYVIKDKYTF